MPSKVWERTKVVFAPTGRIPSFRRLAPWPFLWLGCWGADCTPSLDTPLVYHALGEMRSEKVFDLDRRDGYYWRTKEWRESGGEAVRENALATDHLLRDMEDKLAILFFREFS